jgi:UTP--glucose-1-phosphate uridylyltransferase
MTITKAIIPVAGWGTRRLPITKAIEKCMLPVGNRPIVDYVVEDCVKAGITEIYFVVNKEFNQQIKTYYGKNVALDEYLLSRGKDPLPDMTSGVAFHYIEQASNDKYGTAIPVAMAAPYFSEGESAVVLMGDDFIYNSDGTSEVARLLAVTPEGGNSMLCAQIEKSEVKRYGVVEATEASDYIRIVEHPDPETTPSTLINISKYVMNNDLIQAAQHVQAHESGEYYIIDVMNQYVVGGGTIKVLPAQGQYLDGGNVEGWLHANEVVIRGA